MYEAPLARYEAKPLQASCFFAFSRQKNGSGTWYCLPLSALQKCSGSPSGSNHPPGLVRFLLTQKMRKCYHFRKSSFTDPSFLPQIKFGQKNLLYQYLIIQASSDACASYLREQMLHNAVASSVKAGGKMKRGLRRMKHIAALLQCMKQRWRGTKRSLYPSSPYGLRRDKQASCFFAFSRQKNGSGTWIRTRDQVVNSHLLYR